MGTVRPGLLRGCTRELCIFLQLFCTAFCDYFFTIISFVDWVCVRCLSRLFSLNNWQKSVVIFLLIFILHFASCTHIRIVQLCVSVFACFFAFWYCVCIYLLALFFAVSFCFTLLFCCTELLIFAYC